MDRDISLGLSFGETSTTPNLFLRIGSKRVRLDEEIDDTDDEDEWLLEDVLDKVGLKFRSHWVHPLNTRRPTDGEFVRVCIPLRQYADKFFKYFRMTVATFDYILDGVKCRITKHSRRAPVGPAERLAVTLRYLSTGLSFEALASTFFMDSYTISRIVIEVCDAIYDVFWSKHMPIPTPETFVQIAEEYERLWQFPLCVGAIDGKHIRIKCPQGSGTMFYNYKHFFSIVLQAVTDARYRFIFVDVGAYGKQSDGGIFELSPLSTFVADEKNFPPPCSPPACNVSLPYTFTCDDAYPLKMNMMKPFSGPKLTPAEDIFNGRLSRARRCVECSFGILANKWRLLLNTIQTSITSADTIVKCTTVLHNIVIDREGADRKLLDAIIHRLDAAEIRNLRTLSSGRRYNRSATNAVTVRNCWKMYFNSPAGSVEWQSRYIKS